MPPLSPAPSTGLHRLPLFTSRFITYTRVTTRSLVTRAYHRFACCLRAIAPFTVAYELRICRAARMRCTNTRPLVLARLRCTDDAAVRFVTLPTRTHLKILHAALNKQRFRAYNAHRVRTIGATLCWCVRIRRRGARYQRSGMRRATRTLARALMNRPRGSS